MSPRPKKITPQGNLQEAIKTIAWQQIAETGAAALSLRAIARQLEITAPAIYNYYSCRDDLVTALIIDAYTSLGDTQIAACDGMPPEDLAGRLAATGFAYRQWALDYPQRYQMIFGTPLPGYSAPVDQVLPAAARSLSALVSVVEGLRQAGQLEVGNFPEIRHDFKVSFDAWKNYGGEADILSLSVAVLIWARVHGIVSLEIAGNIPPYGADGAALYRYELESIAKQFIKEQP